MKIVLLLLLFVIIITTLFLSTVVVLVSSHQQQQQQQQQQLPACNSQDYTPIIDTSITPCPTQTGRAKTYRRVTSSAFCRGPEILNLGEFVSCNCTFDELTPSFSAGSENQCLVNSNNNNYDNDSASSINFILDSEGRSRSFSGFVKKDPNSNCVLPSIDIMNSLQRQLNTSIRCPCQESDIGSFYSPCIDGAYRRLVHFWQSDCDSKAAESVSLPPTSYSPCNLLCKNGEYAQQQDPQTTQLTQPCPVGTWAFNGEQWLAPYRAWDENVDMKGIQKQCLALDSTLNAYGQVGCPFTLGWAVNPDGSAFSTGDAQGQDSVRVEMTIPVKLVSFPATLSFEYYVSSQPNSDFFEVSIDDSVIILSQSGKTFWTQFTYTFETPVLPFDSPSVANAEQDHQCQWMISYSSALDQKACFFPNQFYPYDPSLFWFVSKSQQDRHESTGQQITFPTKLWSLAAAPSGGAGIDACDLSMYNRALSNPDYQPNSNTTLLVDATSLPAGCSIPKVIGNAVTAKYSALLLITNPKTEMLRYSRDSLSNDIPVGSSVNIKIGFMPIGKESSALFNFAATVSGRRIDLQVLYSDNPGITRVIRFSYNKDEFPAPLDGDTTIADEARVRNIVITGTQLCPEKCATCPTGTQASSPGSVQCTFCSRNTYAANPGTVACSPCPENTTSGVGAIRCVASRPCAMEDYQVYWSPCSQFLSANPTEWTKTRFYVLKQPVTCNENAPFSWAPGATDVQTFVCHNNCSIGEFLPPGKTVCQSCQSNQIAVIDATSLETSGCKTCPAGEAPEMKIDFRDFYRTIAPLKWNRYCYPEACLGEGTGWGYEYLNEQKIPSTAIFPSELLNTQTIAVGNYVPSGVTSVMEILYTQEIPGTISFSYFGINKESNPLPNSKTTVKFSVLDATFVASKYGNKENQSPFAIFSQIVSIPTDTDFMLQFASSVIYPGEMILRWEYINDQLNDDFILFGIHSLTINGAKAPLAQNCAPCPPGFVCPSGETIACSAGKFSLASWTACASPPDNLNAVVPTHASSTYKICSVGTVASADRTYCQLPPQGMIYKTSGIRPDPNWNGRPIHTSVSTISVLNSNGVYIPSFWLNLDWLSGTDLEDGGLMIPANIYHDKLKFWADSPKLASDPRVANCTAEGFTTTDRSYGCISSPVTGMVSRSIGTMMNLEPRLDADADGDLIGIRLNFTGTKCREYGNDGKDFTVIVDIDCDFQATEFTPVGGASDSADEKQLRKNQNRDPCTVHAKAKYFQACQLCTNTNLAYVDGPCSGGIAFRTYLTVNTQGDHEKTNPPCYLGNYMIPQGHAVKCIGGADAGDVVIKERSWWVGSIAIVLFVIIVVGVIVQLRWKNTSLKHQFLRLQSRLAGEDDETPMGMVEQQEGVRDAGLIAPSDDDRDDHDVDDSDERPIRIIDNSIQDSGN